MSEARTETLPKYSVLQEYFKDIGQPAKEDLETEQRLLELARCEVTARGSV